MKKTRSKKSRNTVPFSQFENVFFIFMTICILQARTENVCYNFVEQPLLFISLFANISRKIQDSTFLLLQNLVKMYLREILRIFQQRFFSCSNFGTAYGLSKQFQQKQIYTLGKLTC
jgi:hypothetical protein